MRPALLVLLLAGPVLAETANLPEGYPPKMGRVAGTVGEAARRWETFDFSIGAFDASAWIGTGYGTPTTTFHLMGYPPGEPDTLAGRLHVEAGYGAALRVGAGEDVAVSILRSDDIDGARLSSEGQAARLMIDSIGPAAEGSYNRRVTGQITARLCPVDWPGEACQDAVLDFDTDMQFETTVVLSE